MRRGFLLGLLLALAAVTAGGGAAAGASASAPEAVLTAEAERPVRRIAGGDRLETATEAAGRYWQSGASTAIVATAGDFPDALAAGPLAAERDAPILLTHHGRLAERVRVALEQLAPDEVIVVGGTAAVSDAVVAELEALPSRPTVLRLSGADRFETARAIASEAGLPAGQMTVASGTGFPDALSAASLLGTAARPPLLLSTSTRFASDPFGGGVDTVSVVGGPAVISDALFSQLQASYDTVQRISGSQRFETSERVAARALASLPADPRPLLVATGMNFPDALAAGALAARLRAPLVLVPSGSLPGHLDAFIRENRERFSEGIVLGGTAAVSSDVAQAVHRALNDLAGPEPDPGCVDLNSADFERLQEIIHIGEGRAQAIIDGRPWASVDELDRLHGIGPQRLQDIKDEGLACVT